MKPLVIPLLFWLTTPVCVPGAAGLAGDVAVVVNENNSIVNVSNIELRKIFAGEKRFWPGGVRITLFVRAPEALERAVLLKLLDMTAGQYKKYWTAQILSGDAQAEPVALFSNGMQREAILVFRGAIALVSAQDLKPGMKVVKVDGRLPGEPGYTLH